MPVFLAGLLLPFGFAPFHLPGLAILGLAIFFSILNSSKQGNGFKLGFIFGLGFFSLGVSWVYVSIHNYGHLNSCLSVLITFLFIVYLSMFTGAVGFIYSKLAAGSTTLFSIFLFSAVWCLGEFCRATLFTGFPWLLVGFGQTDTALKFILPLFGIYGGSFIACLAAGCLAIFARTHTNRYPWLLAFATLLITPQLLANRSWTDVQDTSISVGIVQPNVSMRDKWDENLFLQMLQSHQHNLEALIGKAALVVMPESAIPLPKSYLNDFFEPIDKMAKANGTAILLGMPQPYEDDENIYYNSMQTLGLGKGTYLKQHLVPFGEFIPKRFQAILQKLAFPMTNIQSGSARQALVKVKNYPVATLICYELAYPNLLRSQLPRANWIVSISDDGWFGHSFAMYQKQQMAQALSIQTGRYQVLSNNDGLSSVIAANGEIVSSLPPFQEGLLEGYLHAAYGASPWVLLGDLPILLLMVALIILGCFFRYYCCRAEERLS